MGAPAPRIGDDETADTALGGRVRVIQPKSGFRFSVDAVLLARFAAEKKSARAFDLCCGNGVVGLCLASLGAARRVTGVDLQPAEVDRARRSAAWNGLDDHVDFLVGDLSRAREFLKPQSADLVVCNPPYGASNGRRNPDPARAVARHELELTLEEVVAAAAFALKGRGAFCAVYPTRRLASLLSECRRARLEPKVLRLVHPRPGEKAGVALLRCVKDGGEGLEIRPPLMLHPEGGTKKYTEEAQRLLSGG